MNRTTALDMLARKGYKITGKRETMAHIFWKNHRLLSARAVHNIIKVDSPGISLDTVYRNIRLFEELGILEATELNREKHYCFTSSDHHHPLICIDCGTVKKIEICPMDHMLDLPKGFLVTGHKFEVYGHCSDCHSS
ncbi:transcriptional repressor [Alkalihalobacillus oceani]|uniref:Fur family transcriptional regulator n=1 Tax=Halalkalibacter oceani TaxID=1653776 RepID=UPI00203D34FF|nr:Fur family transcriptional regulator [Halalkalibacter oceani]MCM3763247.1 transcriptional repressor [Halalkalibacter oceani]